MQKVEVENSLAGVAYRCRHPLERSMTAKEKQSLTSLAGTQSEASAGPYNDATPLQRTRNSLGCQYTHPS